MDKRVTSTTSANLVIGVTGHRNLRHEEVPRLKSQIRDFFLDLKQRYPDLPLCLLSSLAAGSDQLAAEVAFELGIRVIAPLPMPPELYRDDFPEMESRAIFDRQLQNADVLTLPIRHGTDPDAVARPGRERDMQYAQAGIFISSHCHILLALWDGHESELLGGTAQVVSFHLQGHMPGPIDRRRAALGMLGLDEETLVYHILAGRQDTPDSTSSEENLQRSSWLTSDLELIHHAQMPETFDQMFRRHAEFNIDWHKYAEDIESSAYAPQPDGCPIQRMFHVADWLAALYQHRVSRVLKTTYLLAALMGFAFIIYADMNSQDFMLYLFLAFFVTGLGVAGVAKRREWHRKYIDYRALAEGLRVQSFWRLAGIVDNNTPSFAHDNFLQKQDVELGWIRNIMRAASLDGILKPIHSGPAEVTAVIDEWIGTQESSGQLKYYSATAAKRTRLHRRSEFLGTACLWLGIGISLLLVVFARQINGNLQSFMVAAMGVLSVAAAVHEAYAYKKADKELIKQYRFMQRIFSAAQRRLTICKAVGEQRQILRTLGEAALAEHAEWTLMHRERPLEHSRL
jgi:hypothetical protein